MSGNVSHEAAKARRFGELLQNPQGFAPRSNLGLRIHSFIPSFLHSFVSSCLRVRQNQEASHEVTKDSKAPHQPCPTFKPSGLDWLGEIPRHWEVHRCAALFVEKDERNEPELPLLNVPLNTGVTLRVFSEDKIESVASDLATMKVARKGDLVFNKMRFWQGAAGIAPADGLVSPDYTVASVSPRLSTDYIESLFRIRRFSREVRRYFYGMVDDRLRLYWDGFKNIWIPVPPLPEQHAIVAHLEAEKQRSTELESALRESIALLKERRSALITAAGDRADSLGGNEWLKPNLSYHLFVNRLML